MQIFDLTKIADAVDRALLTVDNPKHRHILKNYRRHALLEVSGYWEDILDPVMTVEEPLYRITEHGKTLVLDGMKEVSNFYRTITETGDNVFGALEEEVAVSDHGLFIDSLFAQVVRGSHPSVANEGLDPDKVYQVSHKFAGVWPYRGGRLYGEFIYEDAEAWWIDEVDESALITGAQARERLAPLLAESPVEEIIEGLKLFAND